MTDNKNKKREDGATERAQEIVDSLFGKNASAKSAGSQKDLSDDTAGRMATVAGRAVGKVALGFSKGMRAISANNSAKNKGATPTKRKRNTVPSEVNSVKRRSVKSSSVSRTRVVKADEWGEAQSVSDEITRPIDEEIIFGTDKTQVLSDATQVLSSEDPALAQKTQVLTGGGKASSQKTQVLATDEAEEEKQELSSEEAEGKALSEAQDQTRGVKDAEGVDGAEDAEGADGTEGAEGASQDTEAVGDDTSEDGEAKAEDAEDAEVDAEGTEGAEATKGAGNSEADAEDKDAKSDSEDAEDDTDDASAESDADADGASSDADANDVEDDEASDSKDESNKDKADSSEEELEESDEDSEEKLDSSEQDSDEEASEEDDAEDGEDTAEDAEEASEDSEEDTEEAEEDDSEEGEETEDSQDSEDDAEATDDDTEEDVEEEEDDSILSSRRKTSPSKRRRATTSVSAGSVVSSLVRVPLNRHHAKKEAWESSKASRRSVLEDADYTSSYKAYQKMLTKGGARKSGVLRGLHNTPGCYAIATYPPKLKWDRDLASYTDIYVGMAERVGEGVLECCSCHGCADVYADIKYKQNVHVFIYACDEDDLEQLQVELIEILGADKSYNANI